MAAPATGLKLGFSFRDAKGQVARMRVLIGDATNAAVITDQNTLRGHLAAVSNASVLTSNNPAATPTYGTAATYVDVEDKARLFFKDPLGGIHRFEVPAPKAAVFKADQQTVDNAQTDMAALITDFATFVYGHATDTAALAYLGGFRARRRTIRKMSIFTLDSSLTNPAE